jgi:cobalt-zinc-cadmium efflux system outer membrane protein
VGSHRLFDRKGKSMNVFHGCARWLLAAGSIAVFSCAAYAQEASMTLDQALARARQRAPRILAAQDQIREARGRLVGASVLLQENSVVEATAGPRYSTSGDTTDYDVSIAQPLELGGRRRARIAGAQADVDRETAASHSAVRQLLGDVSIAFVQGLAAQQRVRFAEESNRIANDLLQSMQRRFDAGDVPILDVNLAKTSAARVRAELRSAQAGLISALGDLRILLDMTQEEPFTIVGDLKDRRRYELDSLLARAGDRPEQLALAAEAREAQAQVKLGEGFRWPTVAPAVSLKRDQGDRVVQGGISFTLPLFNRGQELRAVGTARTSRLQRELEASRRAVTIETRTAYQVYATQVTAVEELERDALPGLEENETLARRSFEEGEIGLPELLLIRREAFETKTVYVDRLLDAAIAGVKLESSAGVLQ